MGRHRILAERASVACMQKILRILLLRPENSARGLQEIARDFQRIPGRAARADPSVRRRRRLAERALHAPALTPQSHLGGPAQALTCKPTPAFFSAGCLPAGWTEPALHVQAARSRPWGPGTSHVLAQPSPLPTYGRSGANGFATLGLGTILCDRYKMAI